MACKDRTERQMDEAKCIRCGPRTRARQDGLNCRTCWAEYETRLASKESEIEALAQRCARLHDKNRNLGEAVLDLQKDRERLDFLIGQRDVVIGYEENGYLVEVKNARGGYVPFSDEDPREAIDAAIESERAAGEGRES